MAYHTALHALADPTRRAILERLRAGPLPVGAIAEGLPVSRPAVSQHLRVLEAAKLVRAQQDGSRRLYRVESEGLAQLRAYLDETWGEFLNEFRDQARGARRRKKP